MIITFPADKLDSEKFNFRSEQGNFLIGRENTWHGGIHIEGKGIGIKAIADGRIIAYRFEEAYKKVTKNQGKDSKYTSEYSNCFIIMQHDFTYVKHIVNNKGKENESTEKKEEHITFYSLYNHLLPINAYSDKDTSKNVKFPPFLAKKEYQTGKDQKIKGLGVYQFEQHEETKTYKKLKNTEVVLPVNTEFTLADDSKKENTIVIRYKRNGKTKTSTYKKLAPFKDLAGETCTNYYANVNRGISTKLTETTYKTTYKKDISKIKGIPVYNNPSTNAPVIRVLKSTQPLQTDGEIKNGYIPIKGTNEFVKLKHVTTVHTLDESKFKKNTIVACDIPVKAKTQLGYTGLKQIKTNKDYYVCHHEIFMAAENDDTIKKFINHTFDIYSEEENPLDKKKYYKLPKNAILYKTLKAPNNPTIEAKTPVKVIAKKGNFCKVKILNTIERTVEKGALSINKKESKGKKIVYDIINYDYISKIFDGTITKKDTLTHISGVKNSLVKVRHTPKKRVVDYDFWVPISDLSTNYEYETKTTQTKIYKSVRDAESITNYVERPKTLLEEIEYLHFNFLLDPAKNNEPQEVGRKNVTKKTYQKETEKKISGVVKRSLMKTTEGKLIKWTKNDPKEPKHHYPVIPKNTPKFNEINAAFNGKLSLTEVSRLFSNGSFYCNKNGIKGDKNSLYRGLTYIYIEKEEAAIVPNIIHEDEKVIQAILPVDVYKKFEISETNYKILPVDNTGKDPKVHEDVDTLFAFFENKLPNVSGFELKWRGACNEKGDEVRASSKAATHRIVEFNIEEFNKKQEIQSHELKESYTPKVGDEIGLIKDVTDIWLARPDNKDDIDFLLEKPTVVKLTNEKDIILGEENGEFHYKKVETHNLYLGNENEISQKGWVKVQEMKDNKFFSPYNWGQFGFNILDGGDEYIYEIKDSQDFTKTKSEFIKKIWNNFNIMDHVINADEVRFALGFNEVRYEMSRIIAKHKNEWNYTYEEIKADVEKFYSAQINFAKNNECEQSVIDEMENLKQEYLANLKQQVTDLMFWDVAANTTYQPEPPKEKNPKPNKIDFGITDQERAISEGSVATTTLPKPAETKKEKPKQPERIFPANSTVYHFHPIAFVNQMKLMFQQGSSTDYCIQEMKVRAFLRLIKYKEGKPGEEGYKQIVGGGSTNNFNDHPRKSEYIKRLGVSSDAAGAYQFLSRTWDSFKNQRIKLGFKEKDFSPLSQDYSALFYLQNVRSKADMEKYGQVESWGNIWVNKMIKKWKKEYPNITKKSFPKYKTRYADAHGDIIKHLIENNLDRALRAAAPTWASFPDSIHGQESSSYTIVDAKIKFRELLLQEIKGETDLHLEEGFLKKLGYNCCGNKESAITGTSPTGKDPIDLRSTIPWHSQFTADTFGPYSHQSWMCYNTSLMILQEFVGLTAGGKRGNKSTTVNGRDLGTSNNLIQVALEETEVDGSYTTTTPIAENTKTGIDYLDQELEKGNPILVGVRHTYKKVKKTKGFKHEQNHDKSTDHFVIIVGRGYENEKRYFLFYEVGTSNSANGQHDQNRLYVNDDWSITGIPQHNLARTYTLTQIRGNKTNGNFK